LRVSLVDVVVDGHKLRRLRGDLTQGQLAAKSGVSQSHISRLEEGKKPNAKLSTVGKLARALGVPPSTLLAEGHELPIGPSKRRLLRREEIREAVARALGGQMMLSEQAIDRIADEIYKREQQRAGE